jgi:hypothetical protein
MGETETYLIESVVGLGCLVAAAGIWRRSRVRWPALLLAAAGLAAVGHALLELLT